MAKYGRFSYSSLIVLQSLANGYHYGFDIMAITGMHSGTIYPILRRLEQESLVKSRWEKESIARKEQRPRRRYYNITKFGERALAEAAKRSRVMESVLPHLPHKATPAKAEG